MILVVDTSTLLDLESVDGITLLPKLGEAAQVLDVVLAECGDRLAQQIREAGYREVTVSANWIPAAMALKTATLSLTDALVLYYAKASNGVLVASDGPLRKLAVQHSVEVHGAIWVAEQALAQGLIEPGELCAWLDGWLASGRRLPQSEINRLRKALACG